MPKLVVPFLFITLNLQTQIGPNYKAFFAKIKAFNIHIIFLFQYASFQLKDTCSDTTEKTFVQVEPPLLAPHPP